LAIFNDSLYLMNCLPQVAYLDIIGILGETAVA